MSLSPHQKRAEHLHFIATDMRRITDTNGRPTLSERLRAVIPVLADTTVRVVVVGQFKQGKSALINALVSAPVCPVDDLIATSVPTLVRWGDHSTAALITEFEDSGREVRTEIEPSKLRHHVTELAGESGLVGNLRAEVTIPRRFLANGLTLIDTPGVGRAQSRVSANFSLLPHADAAIMVSDATQELTDPELTFLKQAVALCPRVSCAVSKIDLQHQWRDIVTANREHLDAADVHIPVIATSAMLHDVALRESDATLREEARVDDLARYLHGQVFRDTLTARHRGVADDIVSVGEHLAMVISAELQALESPAQGTEIVHSLEQAETRAEQLMQRSSRWQQTLSDGTGDLISDIEFDLRDRMRDVGREAELLIDASDPGKAWDEIGTWLAESITQATSDNFVWAHQRSTHLADVVAQHFSIDGRAAVPELTLAGAQQVIGAIGGLETVRSGKLSLGQKLMIGMKGSYGGVLMFGLMTTLAGMALVNPISVAAGLIMGGFAYRQDATQRLEQRRMEAKTAVRKLIDESIFQVSKESRDRMSRVKRLLRDHFIGVAEDLTHSLNESVRKAKSTEGLPNNERERRIEGARKELRVIRSLCERARSLTNHSTGPVAPDSVERSAA